MGLAEIYNNVRELSRFMTTGIVMVHKKAMFKVMNYCVSTPERGIVLKPNMMWNGNPDFKLVIMGQSDSDFAKDSDTRKSVSGTSTFLCGAPIMKSSAMQENISFSDQSETN